MLRELVIDELAAECHKTAKSKGWWDEDRNDGELICLMHAALSEALECLRDDPKKEDEHCPGFLNLEVELADVIIRVMDFAKSKGLRLGRAMTAKMEYNKTRPHKKNS